jgi:hypothetical protein
MAVLKRVGPRFRSSTHSTGFLHVPFRWVPLSFKCLWYQRPRQSFPMADPQSNASSRTPYTRLRSIGSTVVLHAKKHTGVRIRSLQSCWIYDSYSWQVGVVCAVAYFDPGNWGVDLQAGSQFGFKLLFVVLLAGLLAAFLQASSIALD